MRISRDSPVSERHATNLINVVEFVRLEHDELILNSVVHHIYTFRTDYYCLHVLQGDMQDRVQD